MVFNATVNNISAISWRSVLLVEETGVPYCYAYFIIVSDRCCCGRMVIGFTTTYVICLYYHLSCEIESRTWRSVLTYDNLNSLLL
jgi:hypothetical protein